VSVRKRTWTTRKGEAREAWIVDYTDQRGERHIKTFDRKKEAVDYAAKTKVEVGDGVHVAASKSATIAEAATKWLDGIKPKVERATHVDYKGHVDRFIVPHLGQVKLSDLSRPIVRGFEDRLRESCSEAMVKKVLTTVGTLVADAQERGLVVRNVVHELMRSRKGKKQHEKRYRPKLKVGVDIPTPTEVAGIIEAARTVGKGRWRPLLIVAAFTGLRASELRGLRWEDVDFKKNELHVHQRADRFRVIGRPKTHAGERSVPFGSFVANTLREWKLQCPKGELGLVFPNGKGNVEDLVNIVKRGLIPAAIAAELVKDGKPKYTGMHVFRHFYASWCINRNLPPKVVQERLGHSSITITYDRYGHLFPRGDDAKEIDTAELRVVNATLAGK
jgi:integrase